MYSKNIPGYDSPDQLNIEYAEMAEAGKATAQGQPEAKLT